MNKGNGAGNISPTESSSKDTNIMSIHTRYTDRAYTIHNITKTNLDELAVQRTSASDKLGRLFLLPKIAEIF